MLKLRAKGKRKLQNFIILKGVWASISRQDKANRYLLEPLRKIHKDKI